MSAWNPQANRIFLDAIEIAAPEGQNTFIERACDGDAALRKQVDSLIAASQKAGNFLEKLQSAVAHVATLELHPTERLGAQIGPYKLLEEIGQGGMGVVYMAEQKKPVRRLVALKIVKPGMDSRQVIARFEAERQALALMEHPNIARIIDAGTTALGHPYFVMELVRGIPINEFCDQKCLTLRERLDLFLQVCQAVQHAHQKGIIHRDLKPTNVLVTMLDVQAVPKVIDFGIAKAFGPQLADHTQVTGFAQFVGTPQYMSPEQAEMNQFGVDTRSDVYSLGVVLYELLTGTTPFDKELLKKTNFDELRRMLREQEPPCPSARISTLDAQALSTISERRSVDPRCIATAIRGELDWIVLRSLEKDRQRRYESVNALAADVQRYLDGELVEACPPSLGYRLGKTMRRYKGALVTATAILLALVTGTGIATWEAIRAGAAEQVANQQRHSAEQNLQAAMDAIEKLLVHVGNPELANVPMVQDIRERILTDSLEFYKRFKLDSNTSPTVDYRAAKVFLQLGDLAIKTKPDSDLGITAFSNGLTLANALVLGHGKRNDFRELQAELNAGCGEYFRFGLKHNSEERFALSIGHFDTAQEQYGYLSLTEPGNQDYRKKQGEILARMSRYCHLRSSTDPRVHELANRAMELGYVDYVLMAQITQATDPKRAEQYWRAAIADDKSTCTPFLGETPYLWWAKEASNSLVTRDPELAEGLWQNAIKTLYKLMKEYPSTHGFQHNYDAVIWDYSAFLLQPERKAQPLNKVDALVVSEPSMHALRARVLGKLEDSEWQLKKLTDSIAKYPTQGDYYWWRAVTLRARGELQPALADLNQLVEIDENHRRAYKQRGDVFFLLGEYDKAVEDYTKFITLTSGTGKAAFLGRAAAYFEWGKYHEALADLKSDFEKWGDDSVAVTWISLAKINACPDQDFRNGVLKLADRSLEANSGSIRSRVSRAALSLELGKVGRAREDLSAIQHSDGDADDYYALYQASLIALRLDERAGYRKLCQKLIDAVDEGSDVDAKRFAAWTAALALDALIDYGKAIAFAEELVRRDPDDRQFRTGLGAILLRAGLHEQALVSLDSSSEGESSIKTSSVYTAYFRAMTQHHLNQNERSLASLAEANELSDLEMNDETNPPAWNRRLTIELLRKEAETLIVTTARFDELAPSPSH